MSEAQSDSEAIAASLAEPRCFAVIFERHVGPILRYLRRRLGDQPAEEVAAQTFLIAFDERGRFDRDWPDARPWLFGIATNIARRHRRREIGELRAIAALSADAGVSEDGSEARVDAERMRGTLARCLAALPVEESDVLYLLVWAELEQREISAALGIPLGTVKSRLSRARGRLREALEAPDGDPDTKDLTPTGGNRWTT